MRTLLGTFLFAAILAGAPPAGATSASSYSAAGQPAESMVAGTAIGGATGSGGQTAGFGIDPVPQAHSLRRSDRAGWIGAIVLLALIVAAAVRLRYELRRQRAEGRGFER